MFLTFIFHLKRNLFIIVLHFIVVRTFHTLIWHVPSLTEPEDKIQRLSVSGTSSADLTLPHQQFDLMVLGWGLGICILNVNDLTCFSCHASILETLVSKVFFKDRCTTACLNRVFYF